MKEIKNNLYKINIIKINDIKENNNKLFSDLESIDLLKNNIENDIIYNNIKNLSLLSNNIELTKQPKRKTKQKKKLEIIKLDFDKLNISSDSNDFIEVFSN